MKYMDDNMQQAATQLTAATRQGNLAQAYAAIAKVPYADLQRVVLHAGFSCTSSRNRKDFMTHLQQQVAEACRRRTDGYGLRSPGQAQRPVIG